jgi:hypothetical protein
MLSIQEIQLINTDSFLLKAIEKTFVNPITASMAAIAKTKIEKRLSTLHLSNIS